MFLTPALCCKAITGLQDDLSVHACLSVAGDKEPKRIRMLVRNFDKDSLIFASVILAKHLANY